MESFGQYLKGLRESRGLSLHKVQQRSGVSNAYLSQLEREQRRPPHPEILKKLAPVYKVSLKELLVAAGFLDEGPKEALLTSKEIDRAFQYVRKDPKFRYGTRLQGSLDDNTKLFIIEMYEEATGRQLLPRRAVLEDTSLKKKRTSHSAHARSRRTPKR